MVGEEEEEKVAVMVMVEEEVQGTEVVMKDRVGVGVGTEADDSCVGVEDASCSSVKACCPRLRPYGAISREHVHAGRTSMPARRYYWCRGWWPRPGPRWGVAHVRFSPLLLFKSPL